MSFVDIAILLMVGLFGLFGLYFGFIKAVTSLLGVFVGVYMASRYYNPVADWLMSVSGWNGNAARVVMFIAAFIIIAKLVAIVFYILSKVLNLLKIVPLVKTFNRLLGFLFGLAEGVLTVGIIIYFVERYPLAEFIMRSLAESALAGYFSIVAKIFLPLLPQSIKLLQSTVDYVENLLL